MPFDNAKLIEMMVRKGLKAVYTSLPGVVTAVKPAEMMAKAKISRTSRDSEPLETGWLKINTLYAGEGHGLCLVPYVGDECAVVFHDKNLNDGFIMPFSFNAVDEPPEGHVPLRIGDCLLKHKTGAMALMDKDGNIELWQAIKNNVVMFDGFIRGTVIDGHEFAIQNRFVTNTRDKKKEQSWAKLKHGNQTFVVHRKKYVIYEQQPNPFFCPYDMEQEAKDAGLDLALPFESLSSLSAHIFMAKEGTSDRMKAPTEALPGVGDSEPEEEQKVKIEGGDAITDKEQEVEKVVTTNQMKYVDQGGDGILIDMLSNVVSEKAGDKTEWQEIYKAIYNPKWGQITVTLQRVLEGESLIQLRTYANIPGVGMGEAGLDIKVNASGPKVEIIQQLDQEGKHYGFHKDLIEKELEDVFIEEPDIGAREGEGEFGQ